MADLGRLLERMELVWATPGWSTGVSSSNVGKVGYDAEDRVLYVEFLRGGTYAYLEVPEHVWGEFTSAPSLGQAVYDRLRGANGRRGVAKGTLVPAYETVKLV
jgi:hypothetical protein